MRGVAGTVASFLTGPFEAAFGAARAVVGGLASALHAVASALHAIVGAAQSAASAIRSLPSLPNIDIPFFGGGRAAGGPVKRGTSYMVGERGPELFMAGGSGSIVPNNALAAGGINVYISAPIGSEKDLQDMVVAALAKVNGRGGIS
jgi:hypothetical protein